MEQAMTVGDLKAIIKDLPDTMEIVETRYSDYDRMVKSRWSLIEGVFKDFYIMRSHPTMSIENKSAKKTYLHYSGN